MRRKFSKGCSLHVFEGAEPVTQIKAEREAPDDIDELQRMSVEHHAETHANDRGVEVEELIEEHTVVKKTTRVHSA